MNNFTENKNIKIDSSDGTSTEGLEITTEMQENSLAQETYCLVKSDIYMKRESRQNYAACPVIAGTSTDMYSCEDDRFKIYEPIIKIEIEDAENRILHDSLTEITKIKDSATSNRIGGTGGEKEEDRDESESGSQTEFLDQIEQKGKKYICNVCTKSFEKKGGLDNHLRIHTGERPFTCEICNRSFNRKFILEGHMLTHTGEKPYICDVCKKFFSRKEYLRSHKLIHTGEKPYSCDHCGESFTHKHNLATHKRTHTGEKPFNCDVCNKAFGRKAILIRHRRTHTGEKPYTCEICTKSFSDRANFIRHKKIHK